MNYIAVYFGILVSYLALDGIWLTAMKKIYSVHMHGLMADQPRYWAAAAFYVLYAAGMILLVINPHATESWWKVVLYAAAFGFIAYMTYDFTNLAIIKGFPVGISFVDIVWGTVASAAAGLIGYFILHAFK